MSSKHKLSCEGRGQYYHYYMKTLSRRELNKSCSQSGFRYAENIQEPLLGSQLARSKVNPSALGSSQAGCWCCSAGQLGTECPVRMWLGHGLLCVSSFLAHQHLPPALRNRPKGNTAAEWNKSPLLIQAAEKSRNLISSRVSKNKTEEPDPGLPGPSVFRLKRWKTSGSKNLSQLSVWTG